MSAARKTDSKEVIRSKAARQPHRDGASRLEVTGFGNLSQSQLMSRIGAKGNKTTELKLVQLLRTAGLTGWRRHQNILGRPDFIWKKQKVAVFVDGCFWHGHDCGKNITPKNNRKYWREKISRNMLRDQRVRRSLRRSGWKVVRIWECVLNKNPTRCILRLKKTLEG